MPTVVHVTHEAVQKVGGIGAVLHGLITARAYEQAIGRTILVGPVFGGEGPDRLGPGGEVLYSSLDGIYRSEHTDAFLEIERRFDVGIVYGHRAFEDRASGVLARPEVLLVEVSRTDLEPLNRFKRRLYNRFGLRSDRYESMWDYEQYVRIAEPAYDALRILLGTKDMPCFVIGHEFMGVPTALKTIMEGDSGFRTIFYAHETAPMRRLVEDHPGHDTMFYNVMDRATAEGKYVQDVFGPQDDFFEHALVARSRSCDRLFAVGEYTARELRFMAPEFSDAPVDLVYNGIPTFEISPEENRNAKRQLQRYAENLLGYRPSYVFSHVTRLVVSKGLWRDFKVLAHLDEAFAAAGKTGVLFILSTQGGARSPQDVLEMEEEYGWPVHHRDGYPDLIHGERFLHLGVESYNRTAKAIRAVFVNQFGWGQDACGRRMPEEMTFMDLRKGTDVEFGQSVYEPFGIAQVEPLSFGALCVVSNVCGCVGFVDRATDGEMGNVIVADYTRLEAPDMPLEELLTIGMPQRDEIEARNSREVAEEILQRLPDSDEDTERMLAEGYRVASKMSWEVVVRDYFLPGLAHADTD